MEGLRHGKAGVSTFPNQNPHFHKPIFQACDFVGYYVIYVNLSKMEVIYVIFFRGYYVIFLNLYISL